MFGAFRPSSIASGGLLWKSPWRLSASRKMRQRKRLRAVDDVITAVMESGIKCRQLDAALQLPTEEEMLPKDKYTVFSLKGKGYRKGIHKIPKWTRITQRVNPKGF